MGRKWENIKMKKAQTDGAAAKVNSKYGIEIYVAAKQGVVLTQKQIQI
ncbi:hypothetical protein GCM10025884_09530 [Leuconostoc gelidum subsp. gelidum]|nr:hypothetical protein GCM10025884_09530 [Leuconostoc gelidum subsp. gelidum]